MIWCDTHNVKLNVKWCSTTTQKADELSRLITTLENKLRPSLQCIILLLNPTLDLFASRTNRLTSTISFVNEFFDPLSPFTNGLAINHHNCDATSHTIYAFPPFPLRQQAANVLSSLSHRIIFVYTHTHDTDSKWVGIRNMFDVNITISGPIHCIIHPMKHKMLIDGEWNFYKPYEKVHKVSFLLRNLPLTQIELLHSALIHWANKLNLNASESHKGIEIDLIRM